MRDALVKTQQGRVMALEARKYQKEIAERIRNLNELVHDTFIVNVPAQHRCRANAQRHWEVFKAAKARIRDLGRQGGPEYDRVFNTVKWTWNSKECYEDTLAALK